MQLVQVSYLLGDILFKAKKVLRPGSHGSTKWWIDEHGNVRYDERPKGKIEHPPLSQEEKKYPLTLFSRVQMPKEYWALVEYVLSQYLNKSDIQEYMKFIHRINNEVIPKIKSPKWWKKLNYSDAGISSTIQREFRRALWRIEDSHPEIIRALIKIRQSALKERAEKRTKERQERVVKVKESVEKTGFDLFKELSSIDPNDPKVEEKTEKLAVRSLAFLLASGFLREIKRGSLKGKIGFDIDRMKKLEEYQWMLRHERKEIPLEVENAIKLLNMVRHAVRLPWSYINRLPYLSSISRQEWAPYAFFLFRLEEPEFLRPKQRIWASVIVKIGTAVNAFNYPEDERFKTPQAERLKAVLSALLENPQSAFEAAKKGKTKAVAKKAKEIVLDPVWVKKVLTAKEKKRLKMPEGMVKTVEDWDPATGKVRQKPFKIFPWIPPAVNWGLTAGKGLLALDTGLGKTLTSILIGLTLQEKGKVKRSLIIAPLSLQDGWAEEVKKYFPGKKVLIVRGTYEERMKLWKRAKNYDFVITTYGLLSKKTDDNSKEAKRAKRELEAMKSIAQESAVFFDEATRLINIGTNTRKNTKEYLLVGKHNFTLTATPLKNKPSDLYNLLQLHYPGVIRNVLGSRQAFIARYVLTQNGKPIGYLKEREEELLKKIAPFGVYTRRDDPSVTLHLPPIQNIEQPVTMDELQLKLDELARRGILSTLLKVKDPDSQQERRQAQANILAIITQMRQIALDPRLVTPPKLVPRDYVPPKFERLGQIVRESIANGGTYKGVIVFAEFKSDFPYLVDYLTRNLGIPKQMIGVISGDTPGPERQKIVHDLREQRKLVGILGIKAAGEGLNIQKGVGTVVFLQLPWTHQAVKQALERVHRFGSKAKNVFAYYMISPGSIDSYMHKVVLRKQRIGKLLGKEAPVSGAGLSFKDALEIIGKSLNEVNALRRQKGLPPLTEDWFEKKKTKKKKKPKE